MTESLLQVGGDWQVKESCPLVVLLAGETPKSFMLDGE